MRKLFFAAVALSALSGCVSSKVHEELQTKYRDLDDQNAVLRQENEELKTELGQAKDRIALLETKLDKAAADTTAMGRKYRTLQNKYAELNRNYEYLLENNNNLMASNQRENQKLVQKLNTLQTELRAKEDSLTSEQEKLDYLSAELQKREARVYELESLIAEQENKVNAVKNKLKDALFNFEGKGLSVEQRNGKVYVSLDNSLLFPSGSWNVQSRGKEALQELAKVLADNKELNVVVEGHTDSDPYNGSGPINDNWDLSVKRATSIVKILTDNPGVDPQKITAAGRSEYLPIASNETSEGKAKNRRTEIIITPNLDELMNLLGEAQ